MLSSGLCSGSEDATIANPLLPPPPPEMSTLMTTAGVLELVGGVLIFLGVLTRPVAFILCGMMAVAYWGFHVPIDP